MPTIEAVKVFFQGDATGLMASMGVATKSLSRFGTNAFFLGSRITAGIGLPIALLTKAVVGVGAAFDQAMTESLAIMGRDGQAMRSEMESIAKSIALTTKFSAEEAAQAYFFLASSGMNAAESMKALPVAARFAQAGVLDLEKATELLSDAYITLGLRSADPVTNMENMSRVADVLTEANNQAQGTIIEFAQALTNRAGVAMRVFGIDVETGVAALAAFAERGIKGRTAGRQLFIVIRDLQRAVLKNNDAWVKLIGPNAVFSAAAGEFKNIADIIGVLEDSLDGLSDKTKKQELQMLGFQERSLQATLALVGASDRIRELEDALYSAGGVTQRVSEKQMASFSNQLSLIGDQLKIVAIELFEAFKPTIENFVLPALRALIEKLKELNTWIKNLSPIVKENTVMFMGLTVALGPLIAAFGALSLAMIPIAGLGRGIVKGFGILLAAGTLLSRGLGGTVTGFVALRAALKGITFARIAAGLSAWAGGFAGVGASVGVAAGKFTTIALVIKGLWAVFLRFVPVLFAISAAFGIAKVAMKLFGGAMDAVKEKQSNLAESIGISAIRFTQLVNELQTLNNQVAPLTEDQLNRMAHATEMLAKATGMSVDRLREEINAGTDIVASLGEIGNARWQELNDMRLIAIGKKEVMDDELAHLRLRLGEIRAALATGTASSFALTGVDSGPLSHKPRLSIEGEGVREGLLKQQQMVIDFILEKNVAIGEQTTEIHRLTDATGTWTSAQLEEMKATQEGIDADKETIRQQQIWEIENAKNIQAIDAMADTLRGTAGPAVEILGKGFAKLTIAEIANDGVTKRLWEEYKKLRRELDPSQLPADLEEFTKKWREQSEAEEFAATATGKFLDAMRGVDPVMDDLLKNQGKIVDEFHNLNGVMDPRFFRSHGKVIEDLAKFYGDDLTPELLEIIKKYEEWKKTSKTTTDAIAKNQKKAADAIFQSSTRMAASMMDKQAELSAFSLSSLDAEIIGFKKGYHTMKLSHAEKLAEMQKNLKFHSGYAKTLLELEIFEFIKNADKKLATEKRIGLLRTLEALGANEDIIRNHNDHTDEWLELEIKAQSKAIKGWEAYNKRVMVLTSMGSLLTELAKAIPALDSTARAISGISSATEAFAQSKIAWDSATSGIQKFTAGVGMAIAAVQAFNAISQIKSKGGRAAAGAMAGAQMGSAFGPEGALIGAGIGALAGLISGDPGWAKIQDSIRKNWHVNVTEELSKAIEKTRESVGSDFAAMTMHLSDIIDEQGGVLAMGIGNAISAVRDIFSAVERGALTTDQAAETFGESFNKIATALVESGGIASASFVELITLAERFGTSVETIKFVGEQSKIAAEGLAALFGPTIEDAIRYNFQLAETDEAITALNDDLVASTKNLVEMYKGVEDGTVTQDQLNAALEAHAQLQVRLAALTAQRIQNEINLNHLMSLGKAELEDLGLIAVASFQAAIAAGMSYTEAIKVHGPALDAIIAAQTELGITSDNVALQELVNFQNRILANTTLVAAVEALDDTMLALSRTGSLNAETMGAMERQGLRMYNKLIAAGFSQEQAIMMMAPALQTILDAHEQLGIPIDENTQALIDQAREQGLLGDAAETVDAQMLAGIYAMVDAIEALVTLFRGDVPGAMDDMSAAAAAASAALASNFETASTDIQDDFNNIKLPDFNTIANIRIQYDDPGFNFNYDQTNYPGPQSYAQGGIISRPTLAMTGEGGEPEMIGPVGFMSKALEGAMAKTGPSQVEREMLDELHGLRGDLKTLPIHLRDAIILAG
jgi:TP901 family phage tail tape measure protein